LVYVDSKTEIAELIVPSIPETLGSLEIELSKIGVMMRSACAGIAARIDVNNTGKAKQRRNIFFLRNANLDGERGCA
jgi:hypothetical protein